MAVEDQDHQSDAFFGSVALPLVQRVLSLIGGIALIYGLIQFVFESDVPESIRQGGLVLGALAVTVVGLGFAFYQEHQSHKKQRQELQQLINSSPRLAPPDAREVLPGHLESAIEMVFVGLTLENLLHANADAVRRLASDPRKQLRFLLPDLDSLASAIDCIGLEWGQSHRFQQEIMSTLEWLSDLAAKPQARIEIRLTKELPTVSLLILDPLDESGMMRVSLHLYEGSYENRPYFEISKRLHRQWFEYFQKRYYEDLWKKAIPWEPGILGYAKRAGLIREHNRGG